MIIDTVGTIIRLAQREGSTPVAPLDCGTSCRQSKSNPNHRHNLFYKSLTSNNKTIQHPISKHLAVGIASWNGPGFYGRRTANGEILRKGTLTAAHRTLPFGTIVRVTNLENGKSVNVRINDRGPFKYHRVIDLAHGAASELRMMRAGEIKVNLEVID